MTTIKNSFMDRRRDVKFVMEREKRRDSGKTSSSVVVMTNEAEGSVTKTVDVFRESLFVLDEKIKK